MDEWEVKFDKNFDRMTKAACLGVALYFILWTAVMVLIIWLGYEGIQYLRRN